MTRPDELALAEPLRWSAGIGTDVWEIICACRDGDVAAVARLLTRDPALVRCHYHYRKPLYFAVRENRVEVAALLLDLDPDPIGLAVNDTLVEIARDRGLSEMEALIEKKLSDRHGVSRRGEPVAAAIREGDVARMRSLLDRDPGLLEAGDLRGNRPIHWAAMTRRIEVIDELVVRGANLDTHRTDGARPIQLGNGDYHFRGWRDVPSDHPVSPRQVIDHLRSCGAFCDMTTAAHLGDLDRVRAMLDGDRSLANRPSDYVSYYACSGTPLRNAAAAGHLEIVRLLLGVGADPNLPEEGIAPRGHSLYAAATNGHFEVVSLLLEHGAHPNAEVESSADALTRVISNGDRRMLDLLCSHGASRAVHLLAHENDLRTAAAVFAADSSLANDLEAFENARSQEFVRLMLRYRPDLVRRVSMVKDRELTAFLFEQGMDPNLSDWLGVAPLHRLARDGNLEGAGQFLDHGADLEARDEDICSSPLGWAAKFGQEAMVEFLLNRGAVPGRGEGPAWAAPLAWAERRGHDRIARILRRHGA